MVGFINGIPLVFFELKAHHQDLQRAYKDNLKDYKDTVSHVFHNNAFIILSNGIDAKVGTITSPYKYFLDWKRIEKRKKVKSVWIPCFEVLAINIAFWIFSKTIWCSMIFMVMW